MTYIPPSSPLSLLGLLPSPVLALLKPTHVASRVLHERFTAYRPTPIVRPLTQARHATYCPTPRAGTAYKPIHTGRRRTLLLWPTLRHHGMSRDLILRPHFKNQKLIISPQAPLVVITHPTCSAGVFSSTLGPQRPSHRSSSRTGVRDSST